MTVTDETIVLRTFADAKDAYRAKDLRQSLYDEGEVVMDGVLVNLHGDEHRNRRRVENRMFRRDVFDQYERELFPAVTERTVAPHLAAGKVDLVHLGHELMLNLAALTAGIDRPKGTVEETARLGEYNAKFIQGATLAHSTGDKDAQRVAIARGAGGLGRRVPGAVGRAQAGAARPGGRGRGRRGPPRRPRHPAPPPRRAGPRRRR